MSTLWALALPVLQPALVALVTSLLLSIPAAAVAFVRWAWTRATANKEDERSKALARLGEIGARAGAQLANTIMADPTAAAAIQAAKDALVTTMAANVAGTLARIGGNTSGVEQLVLGKAAEALPGALATVAAAGVKVPDFAAAAEALKRLHTPEALPAGGR